MNFRKNQNGMIGPLEIVAVVAVLAIVGFVVFRVTRGSTNKLASQGLTEELASVEELTVVDINTLEEMEALAGSELGTASIVGYELDQDGTDILYKLRLSDGRVLVFNATSGAFIESEEGESESEAVPNGFVAGVSLKEAISIAQAERPGKTVAKVEFEVEDGVGVYSVRFTDSGRVDVSAAGGAVVKVEAGDEEDEAEDEDENDDSGKNEDEDSDSADDDEDENDDSSNSGKGNSDDDEEDAEEQDEDEDEDEDEEDSDEDDEDVDDNDEDEPEEEDESEED